jgi:hypothetical protein
MAAVGCVLALAGCTTDSAPGLDGTWLITYESPIEYDPDTGASADAQIFTFAGSEVEMIFYLETEQVFGQRGTYTASEGTLSLTLDEWWDSFALSWESDDDAVDLTYSLGGDTLSITPPGETQGVDLARTSFTVRSELAGTWYGTGEIADETLEARSDGDFYYMDGELLVQSGIWDASAGYIRSVDTLVGYRGYLSPYELRDSGSTLVTGIEGDQQTYTDTAQ